MQNRALHGEIRVRNVIARGKGSHDFSRDGSEMLQVRDIGTRHTLPDMSRGSETPRLQIRILGPGRHDPVS